MILLIYFRSFWSSGVGQDWGRQRVWVEREGEKRWGMVLEQSFIDDEQLLISMNLICVLSG